jgi:hypothetical protein
VEFIAVLPLVLIVGAAIWQLALGGQAIWLVHGAAGAAAREQAVGGDEEDVKGAAERRLPDHLEGDLKVVADEGEERVRVSVGVPSLLGSGTLTHVGASAHFYDQEG